MISPLHVEQSDVRFAEANRRLALIEQYKEIAGECSVREAARRLGSSPASLWRYVKAYERDGFNGLLDKKHLCGRKTEMEKMGLTEERLRELLAEVKGLNLDVESTTMALRLFAHSDRCPEVLASAILNPNKCSKHAIAPSIRRAAAVTKNERDAHRGPRTLSLKGIWIPRRIDILPGDVFVPDDTTPIFGWWVPWETSEEYPFGVKLLQGQLLRIIDVASQCPVGRVLIAREKSSYRASDIWSWVGFMADDIGLPRLGFQMERGSWDATLLQGQEAESAPGDVSHGQRVGGLRQLPTNITAWHREKFGWGPDGGPKNLQTWTSYLPKSKSIEAYFNRIQSLEGCLYGSLGRDQMRRPYEKAKKLFQQCSRPRAKIDPRQHFLSGTELMARLNGMDEFLANEPMEGEVFNGIPRQRFEAAVREHPLFMLPEEQRWLYRRDWKALQITQGWARVRLTDPMSSQRYSLFYVHPEIFAEIEGASVLVYYDRQNFEAPAQIVAASHFEARGRAYRPGDYVCEAGYFERPGSFLDGDSTGHDIRRRWKNAVMTVYGRASIHAPSRQVPAEILARREEARQISGHQISGHRPDATPVQVDGRPAPAAPRKAALPAPTPDEWRARCERLKQQANLANRIRGEAEVPQ